MGVARRLWNTYETLDLAHKLTGLGLVVLSALLQALGLRVVDPDTSVVGFWRLFAQTAPLTVSFTLIISICRSSKGANESWFAYLWELVVICVFVLFVATFIAVQFGHLNIFDQPKLFHLPSGGSGAAIPLRAINLIYGYYTAYGPDKFWSSLVLAIALHMTLSSLNQTWKPDRTA